IDALARRVEHVERRATSGGREYVSGTLCGTSVVVVRSGIGKTAAACTTTHLILECRVERVLFTGLAGSIDPRVEVGDIVVADRLAHHDMDASPLFPRYEVPLSGRTWFDTDPEFRGGVAEAASAFLTHDRDDVCRDMSDEIPGGRVHVGGIVSGDQFIDDAERASSIRQGLPGALCVEMEGAAAAQVCAEHGIPCAVVRTISDRADHEASDTFMRSLDTMAGLYTLGVVRRWLTH
ncbi:MAG: 5'-methylthioadenosine/adenosylhomocysteine nucleosidase, partial [Phycisphaerales bacterium]|nr:5'-methylthioadenosine/adenosylhomocysteine nucleosidase [Phycisphaerales bacterium]